MSIQDDIVKYQDLAKEAIRLTPDYPTDKYHGRGIVICGGGPKYFTCAWVNVLMLRHHKCFLPVEIWYLGPEEMSQEMTNLMSSVGATCIDAFKVREKYPVRRLAGWELIPYSIIHSQFDEVLFLDADNMAIRNPEFLFGSEQYLDKGAVFWPDYGNGLNPDRSIWDIMGIPFRREPEFESGQILVDKKKCWNALNLTMHLNEHADFYYTHIHGDKDTFHMAWNRLEQPYHMIDTPIHNLVNKVMCQHDFDGRILFQHRNMAKWQYYLEDNIKIKDFRYEKECFQFLKILRNLWTGRIDSPPEETEAILAFRERIIDESVFMYCRSGVGGKRRMRLAAGGQIAEGAARLESEWEVLEKGGHLHLCLVGSEGILCYLKRNPDGNYRGKWISHEMFDVEMIPLIVKQKTLLSR